MRDQKVVCAFLQSEVEQLEAFDFVIVMPAGAPIQAMELTRGEEGSLEVRVPGRREMLPELTNEVQQALSEREFASEAPEDQTMPWVRSVPDAETAVTTLMETLAEVFGGKPDARLDVAHGSHRAEHEAQEKLAIAHSRIGALVEEILGKIPERDKDGDFILPIGDVHVMVSPRVVNSGQVVVRVFAITNVGVAVTPELGLFLARMNFGLMFGRFALDAEHGSIWFDEAILGELFREEELRFAVQMVASTADNWDDRLKQMFGGVTYQEMLAEQRPEPASIPKPGEGGGQYL